MLVYLQLADVAKTSLAIDMLNTDVHSSILMDRVSS